MIFCLRRIGAVFMRYFYTIFGLHQVSELFFWPLVDILLWGLTTVWLQQQQHAPNLALIILTALIFWQIITRATYDISVNLLQEFWNRNLINLFATPLTEMEWAIGSILLSFCKISISLSFGALVIYLLYALNVFTIGWYFLPFAASLMLSGLALGFLSSCVIIRWGQKLEMLAWMSAFFFAPFSAVFYPVASLPHWAQSISWCLPMTYIFEGMREVLRDGRFSLYDFLISLALNIFYLAIAVALFKYSFYCSRVKGLARLE
jgi:ABC-2 type transport system permease protein